ncbi:MAG: hypothetical protein ACLPN5_13205 [Roseiarcus sp.]
MRSLDSCVDHSAHERILADALVDVATELRLADPAELLLMIRSDHEANIADLVNSSSELFFKAGSLRYGLVARYELGWESTPSVRLDMEFRHAEVTVFFRLTIGRARGGVEVVDIFIDDGEPTDVEVSRARLAQAIAEARVV